MERKWFKSWPENMPRTLVFPEKPLPEFLSDHARKMPEKVAINFYGREVPFRVR
jgi:long-chain acyl-CoA synthetase